MGKHIDKVLNFYKKHWIIYTSVLYSIFVLYVIHYHIIGRENPRMTFFDKMPAAFWDMLFNPLSIFPLPRGWVGDVIFVTFAFTFFFIITLILRYLQRQVEVNHLTL